MFLDVSKRPGDPDAVKTADEIVAENTRLRDIVRRLADIVRHDCDERAMALTREAYAALGEDIPE